MHAPLPKLPAKLPTERPRARRERRSDGARQPVLHVVLPGLEVARELPLPRETVAAFLRRTGWAHRDRKYGWQFRKGLPTILRINGKPVLRAQWRSRRIGARDHVRFETMPLGGSGSNGKQILGLVALVAVSAFAMWAGPALAAGLGLTGTAATIAGGVATAAIGLGGALAINALTAPKAGATNDPNATTDQIYTVQAQGNVARLGQPLPVWYGRLKAYPDFAATPWSEFVGNDQYLNILLSVTMGSMSYEQLLIEDTPFWNPTDGVLPVAPSAQVAFYEPGAPVTLFPTNVDQSAEVTGQQLPHGTGISGVDATTPGAWIGPFVANPAGTQTYQIAVDYVFAAGCFQVDDKGNTTPLTVSLTAERQAVNDAGAPIGDWVTLVTVNKNFASRSPIRDTLLVAVPNGRYQVRFRRNDGVPDDNKGASDIVWAGLRTYLVGQNSFPDVSTIAIRIKADESTQGSYKFGVIGTRKLPVWHADTATFVTEPTRSAEWAFLDAAINAQYGAGHPVSKTDFNTIVNRAAASVARGDHFDYVFTAAVACPTAFDTILTPTRSRHFWLGDTLSSVRDEWRDIPSMLLTDREIVRDSTQITWTLLGPSDGDPDAVIIEYVDENTWRPATVQYPPNTELFTAANPSTKRIDGICNRDHAFRECAFWYLQSIYRREKAQIDVEFEGRAITFGSVLRVQSELPMAYGYGGAVTSVAGSVLALDPAPSWADVGPHFMRLRRRNGTFFGPVSVARGVDDAHAILDAGDLASVETQQGIVLADVLARDPGAEDPSFDLGTADNQSRLCLVVSGAPKGGNLCTLSLVVDDERVHATDLGTPPIPPVGQFPSNSKIPLLLGLNASFGQGVAEPTLRASWFPSAGAFYYIADVSYDDGNSWINVYEGADNKFEKVVTLGAVRLRVQGVGSVRGPYATVDLDAPTIEIASGTVAAESLNEAIKNKITTAMADITKVLSDTRDFLDTVTADAAAQNWIDKDSTQSQLVVANDGIRASVEIIQTVAISTQEALAAYQIIVDANFDTTNANVSNETLARASADSALASNITDLSTTVGGHTAELTTVSASVDGLSVQYGVIGTIDGVSGSFIFSGVKKLDGSVSYNVAINGGLIVNGTVLASAINTPSLSAISVNAGTITSGTIIISD